MDALTFFNKQLNDGDRVRLTLTGGHVFEGYFGGYKCFEGTTADLHYNVFPVFYRPGKKGQYVRRSLFESRTPYVGFSEIEDVERIVTEYRHIGYYNNPDDCYNLALRGHKAALHAWKNGYGDFHNVDNNEVFTDVVPDYETRILDDGRYAVRMYGCCADSPDNGDYGGYIDIFERIGAA